MVINKNTAEILCTAYGKGKEHDFSVFKKSKVSLKKDIKCLADKGYQGIQNIHNESQIPIKKPKDRNLSKEEKKSNKELAKERIIIEHVNRYLKIFRILSEKYRNRRRRFRLRFNLIAAIYNFELNLVRNNSA